MSQITDDHECFDGFVYVDPVKELERRGLDPSKHPAARFMRKCPVCAARNLIQMIGGGEMSWENWTDRAALSEAVTEFQNWYPSGLNWACLVHARPNDEPRSTGKTHLLSAAGTSYIRVGKPARYWNAGDLSIRRYESLGEVIMEFSGFALIDDLGNEANNLDTRDAVDRILDARYRHRRPSIITSILSFDVIEKRYPRFGRRMKGGTAIPWSATPYCDVSASDVRWNEPVDEHYRDDDDLGQPGFAFGLNDSRSQEHYAP